MSRLGGRRNLAWCVALAPLTLCACAPELTDAADTKVADGDDTVEVASQEGQILEAAPTMCAAPGDWPTLPGGGQITWSDAQYSAVQRYDRCYSSTKNYERTSEDFLIENTLGAGAQSSDIIRARFSTALAGGIASLRWGGAAFEQEFVAAGGHGSAFGFNLVSAGDGECYNPTEFGSKLDDCKDLDGNYAVDCTDPVTGPKCAEHHPGQLHGPSSTAFYPNAGSNASGNGFVSSARMAFYIPEGWQGFGGCTANYDGDAAEDYGLSPFALHKTVTIDVVRRKKTDDGNDVECDGEIVVNWPVLKHVARIESDAGFMAPAGHPAVTMDLRFAMYLPRDYTRIWKMGTDKANMFVGTRSASEMSDYGEASLRAQPLIYVSDNQWWAVSTYTQSHKAKYGTVEAPYYWADHSDTNNGFEQRMLQVTARGTNNWHDQGGQASVDYSFFTVLGGPDQVNAFMQVLTAQCADDGCC